MTYARQHHGMRDMCRDIQSVTDKVITFKVITLKKIANLFLLMTCTRIPLTCGAIRLP